MKKLLLAAAGTAALLAAATANAQTIRVVEVLTTPERTQLLEGLITAFESENEGVNVELISIPWDTSFERVLTMTQSGQAIDVIEMPERWISTLDGAGALVDLQPYFDQWGDSSPLSPASIDLASIYDDRPMFVPYGYFIRAMFYNNAMLEEAGVESPPETLDEFIAAVMQVSNNLDGRYGYCMRGGRGGFVGWWLFMSAMTGSSEWWDEDGNSIFNTPEAIEAIQAMLDLYQDGGAPPDSVNWAFNEQVSGFYTQNCAFLDQDPDALIQITERLEEDQFSVIPVPLGPQGTVSPPMGIIGWSVASASEHPDVAWDFINHLSSFENNLEWARFIGVVPAAEGADEDPYYRSPIFAGFFQELEDPRYDLRPWPAHLPELGYFFDVLAVETAQSAMLGDMTAEELGNEWAAFLTEAQQAWLANQDQ